jgi:hypothetical protein
VLARVADQWRCSLCLAISVGIIDTEMWLHLRRVEIVK